MRVVPAMRCKIMCACVCACVRALSLNVYNSACTVSLSSFDSTYPLMLWCLKGEKAVILLKRWRSTMRLSNTKCLLQTVPDSKSPNQSAGSGSCTGSHSMPLALQCQWCPMVAQKNSDHRGTRLGQHRIWHGTLFFNRTRNEAMRAGACSL